MDKVINTLNDNPGLIALVSTISGLAGVILGWGLNTFSDNIKYKRQKKDDEEKDVKERFKHKAEFIHNQWFRDDGKNTKRIEVVLCTYQPVMDKSDEIEISYPKKLSNKAKLKTEYFYFENIGESDINELEVAVSNPKTTALIPEDSRAIFIKDGAISYGISLDQKIRKGEALELVVHYLEDDPIISALSSSLEIYYRDSLHNICRQPFFPEQRKVYEPSLVSQKEWREQVGVEKNLEHWRRRLQNK